jgi:hypothetical protein
MWMLAVEMETSPTVLRAGQLAKPLELTKKAIAGQFFEVGFLRLAQELMMATEYLMELVFDL